MILDLFTLLVFLLVVVGVYTARAWGRRQRQEAQVAQRLLALRDALRLEQGAPMALADERIDTERPSVIWPAWPWMGRRLQTLRQGLQHIGWLPTLRQRVVATACAAWLLGLLLGRMTPYPVWVSLGAGLVLGAVILAWSYQAAYAKYLEALARSLPEMIDAITRICRAGVPLQSAFAIAAEHQDGPLSAELLQLDQWLRLGQPLRQVMQESAQRIPLAEYRFFAVILIISQESGGRLGETLDRLTSTLRARAELKLKVLAKTSEARASTKIVALLVPGVLAYMYLNAPADFRFMFSDAAGLKVTLYASISVGLGLLITHLMVRRIG